jgi:hypothetical protein
VDKEFLRIRAILESPDFDASKHKFRDRYSLKEGLLFWHDNHSARLCVPQKMRSVLLRECHDTAIMGHMGVDRTYNTLCKEYYWPHMHRDVHTYVNSCTTCQQNKASNEAAAGLARPLPVPDKPHDVWGLDFIIMPPNKDGKNCVAVFVCHKSKKVHAVAATMTGDETNALSAEQVACIYFDTIFKHYGLCSALVSDRDVRFVSAFWRELHKLCGTSLFMSTAFHPQTDGLTERANSTLTQTLRCILTDHDGDWAECLTAAEFSMNNAINASTGISPFFMTLGCHPRVPTTFDITSCNVPAAAAFVDRLQALCKRSEDSMLRAQISQIAQMDTHRRISPFKVGDLVYLSTKNIDFAIPNKFKPKYVGPFKILELHGRGNAAKLELPDTFTARRLHDVFNVSLLKPYSDRPADLGPQRHNQPPPIADTNDGQFYAVDRVMQVKNRRNVPHVLVHWKGYGHESDTWVPYARFKKDCPEALAEWDAKQPPPRPPRQQKSKLKRR